MAPIHGSSLFQALSMREVKPCKVRGRPNLAGLSSEGDFAGSGVLTVGQAGVSAPPLGIAYGKKRGDGHMLAVADEEGYVTISSTQKQLPNFVDTQFRTDHSRRQMWLAHTNAIFDICWMQDDKCMLTASGDQTIRLWDIETLAPLGLLKGHFGSVKSLCIHPSNADLFASGSRDGSVALWDVRSSASTSGNERCFRPVDSIKDTHAAPRSKHTRRRKGETHSVTAVMYQRDDRILATSGAADGVVKFWDTRKFKTPVVQTPNYAETSEGVGRVHGIASLSQDPTSSRLIVSCTDNKIYMYDGACPEKGAICNYSGHVVGSFYIKAAFSPDGAHIMSGSTDSNVYIWEVDHPSEAPVVLEGHTGEVTAVDWCSSSYCKIATSSDDCTVRVWSMKELRFSQRYTSPPLVCHRRHRISAQPLSPEPEPVSSDLIVKGSQKQMIKSHATASLSELDPNLLHGESEHGKEDKSYSISPMQDRRKRPRTIRDYFSPQLISSSNLYNNFGLLPDSSRCHLIHWQR